MADTSFIEKLRMNNIFPADGGNPSPLIGMPNFNAGRPQMQMQIPMQQEPGLQQVSQRIQQPQQAQNMAPQQPMGTAYKAPRSDEFATNIIMGETAKDKDLALKGQIAANKNSTSLKIADQKNALAKFKAEHPNMKFIVSKGGNVQAFDQITGEGFDTGIDSGTLSEQDKIELTGEQTRKAENTRQTGRMELQTTKGNQALEQIGARITGNKDVAQFKANETANKPLAPTQVNQEQKNAARELLNTKPELAKFVTIDDKGNPTVTPPGLSSGFLGFGGGSATGPTKEQFDEINNAIFGKKASPLLTNKSKTDTADTTKPKTSTTTKAKPTAAELIKKYGG